MPRASLPLLSKSRFTAGLQCPGRLYRTCYQRELATPPDAAQQARFDAGTRVGEIARALRPGGTLVDDSPFRHEASVARTRSLIDGGASNAIYEAAFTEGGVRVRADILARANGGWEMIEVKSSTSVKDEHIPGIDTGERSFPYVAGWAKDKAVLKNVLSTIQTASATLIEGVQGMQPSLPSSTE